MSLGRLSQAVVGMLLIILAVLGSQGVIDMSEADYKSFYLVGVVITAMSWR